MIAFQVMVELFYLSMPLLSPNTAYKGSFPSIIFYINMKNSRETNPDLFAFTKELVDRRLHFFAG